MSERNLNIGPVEIMPKVIEAESLKELQDKVKDLGDVWRISDWRLDGYIHRLCKELNVWKYLSTYEYVFVKSIELTFDDGQGRYKTAIIDDPQEIVNYMNGEEALMFDEDGNDYEVKISSSMTVDTNIAKSSFYICRDR
jgi:hypothetical protein